MIKLKNIYQHSYYSIYNINDKRLYSEDSDGYWLKHEYDKKNNVYSEDSNGYWAKHEFDEDDNIVYEECSCEGIILDNRYK